MAREECEPSLFSPLGLDFLLCDEEPNARPASPGCTMVGSAGGDQSLCLLQTLEEIAELQQDIRHLEEDLRRKFLNLKLCHTRLESRTYRPNVELCRDQVRGDPNGGTGPLLRSPQDHSLPSTYSWWRRGY